MISKVAYLIIIQLTKSTKEKQGANIVSDKKPVNTFPKPLI